MNIVIECSPSSELADDLPDPDIFNCVSAFTTSDNTNTVSQSLPISRSETVSTVASTAESFVESLGTSQINISTSESWKRETIPNIIKLCSESNIVDPIEILRIAQGQIIKGRKLELDSESTTIEGDTNFILTDRENLLETSFIEIKEIEDLRTTLEVQFYEEVC